MAVELKVPEVGESITEAMIGEWLKAEGDRVEEDETLVILETDKVNVELPAPQAGVLKEILKRAGDEATVGEVIGYLEPGGPPAEGKKAPADRGKEAAGEEPARAAAGGKEAAKQRQEVDEADDGEDAGVEPAEPQERPAGGPEPASGKAAGAPRVMPAARRLLAEAGLDAAEVEATGKGGRLTKGDVLRHLEEREKAEEGPRKEEAAEPSPKPPAARQERPSPAPRPPVAPGGSREEEAVRMTPLRRRVAERLVQAQQQAALLTTFNEIDMSRVIALRQEYQERFRQRHGIKLGFMSFFVKAAIEALKEIPEVNAEIRGEEIVYRNYYDVGIAVGGGRGLVVPIIRNAERLSFAETEEAIADFAARAGEGQLKLEELQGGTFTLSNGGIYGSLLSTPIVNPPQSGILGMHKIEERPVAVEGQVVIRPMMYVALTYDHRLVDGREAVTFLVRLKERIEDPARILLEV